MIEPPPALLGMNRLILVFDADSGLAAMLLDVAKKAVGREDCALCEITYGPLGKRRSWAACEARLGLEVVERHRDELPVEWEIPRTELPCVLLDRGGARPEILLNRAAIASLDRNAERLERAIRDALSARV
jgi:hypothetical protein